MIQSSTDDNSLNDIALQRELLCDCLELAHADLLSTHNRLTAGIDFDIKSTLLRFLGDLEYLGDICEKMEFEPLQTICKELHHHIRTSSYRIVEYLTVVNRLIVWTDDVLAHIDAPDDPGLIQLLFIPLPKVNKLFLMTMMGLVTESAESISANISNINDCDFDSALPDGNINSDHIAIDDNANTPAATETDSDSLALLTQEENHENEPDLQDTRQSSPKTAITDDDLFQTRTRNIDMLTIPNAVIDDLLNVLGEASSLIVQVGDRNHKLLRENLKLDKWVQNELVAIEELYKQQQRLTKKLQLKISSTRLVSVGSIRSRLQRAFEQVCKQTNKIVDFEIIGSDTVVDSFVLNKLVNPLLHLLRNAVEHGIESAEERTAEKKPSIGSVKLTIKRTQYQLQIQCADDGGGLDYTRIRKKAISQGLIRANDELNISELSQIILNPGFSTRESKQILTSRLPDCAVGMDAVLTVASELGGTLDIKASESGGALFILEIPLKQSPNK